MKDNKLPIQEAQRTPNRINTKKNTPKHIIVKVLKPKIREYLESSQKEKKNYIEISNKALSSLETVPARWLLRPICISSL